MPFASTDRQKIGWLPTFGRRMMTSAYPNFTRSDDERVIEPEGFNSCPAAGGQANDACAIFTPGKVVVPRLLSWMKEGEFFACVWV
ncbi:MAG: hypothetical protein AB1791_09635 [Chloroflexota bacterium]